MPLPKAIVFDLDNTLAESKQDLSPLMAERLTRLLKRIPVAITTGAKLGQLLTQVVGTLPSETDLSRLYLLPTAGAAMYHLENGIWEAIHKEVLHPEEAKRIMDLVHETALRTGTLRGDEPSYGERLEHRESSVAFSALGQEAPLHEKNAWDPDKTKRLALREVLMPLLPEHEIRLGGATTVDITRKGIDKAYGLEKLSEELSIPISDMLYVGDDLGPGGNDEVVIATGITTHAVKNPGDTLVFIDSLFA